VGILSSTGVPNPNGVPLLSWLLSWLPDLWSVSVVLGLLQALAALALWAALFTPGRRPGVVLLPLLASVRLRGISVEFWQNWLLVSVDLLFVALLLRHLRRPLWWHRPLLIFLVLSPPALYLGGVLNAALFAILWLGSSLWNGNAPDLRRPRWGPASWIACTGVAIVFGLLVWRPYFTAVTPELFALLPNRSVAGRVFHAAIALPLSLGYPFRVLDAGLSPILQSDSSIVTRETAALVQTASALLYLQAATTGLFLAWSWQRLRGTQQAGAAATVFVCAGFVVAAHVLSPLLGGPRWHAGDRPDQSIQCWPFVLVLLFGLPFWLGTGNGPERRWRWATAALAVAFSAVSGLAGVLVVRSHLDYRGPVLSRADVPLRDKQRVVEWIARDWQAQGGGRTVPVRYALASGAFAWIPEFAPRLDRWYPQAMSLGRAFDYELLRRFGMTNAFEGRRQAAAKSAHYVVAYAMDRPPSGVREKCFGRLCVYRDADVADEASVSHE
jgi:hypothetical protein